MDVSRTWVLFSSNEGEHAWTTGGVGRAGLAGPRRGFACSGFDVAIYTRKVMSSECIVWRSLEARRCVTQGRESSVRHVTGKVPGCRGWVGGYHTELRSRLTGRDLRLCERGTPGIWCCSSCAVQERCSCRGRRGYPRLSWGVIRDAVSSSGWATQGLLSSLVRLRSCALDAWLAGWGVDAKGERYLRESRGEQLLDQQGAIETWGDAVSPGCMG